MDEPPENRSRAAPPPDGILKARAERDRWEEEQADLWVAEHRYLSMFITGEYPGGFETCSCGYVRVILWPWTYCAECGLRWMGR